MIRSTSPCPRATALRQAFNAALRHLVDKGVRNQLLLKYKLPLSFAVELQGPSPPWPQLSDLRDHDMLLEVLQGRVLRVATVLHGASHAHPVSSFNGNFLREIVNEIDRHYSGEEGLTWSGPRRMQPIQVDYVVKASTAVVLQALDAGEAHMTDINMGLSHNPFNGITLSSRYSRSDQVMTQSTLVIVKSDSNIASLPALRDSIFFSFDQEGRTVLVDNAWNQQTLARVLPPYTIYELLSEGAPASQLLDILMDEEAVAATAQLPLPWPHRGLRSFAAGATYASGALFLMDRQSSTKCLSTASHAASKPLGSRSGSAAAAAAAAAAKPGEDPALSSLRRELTKKSVGLGAAPAKYYMSRRNPMWGRGPASELAHGPTDSEDSYPSTPGPWTHEPTTPVGEKELFDGLRVDAGEPLASARRYLRTRALQDSYNTALVQLLRNSVLEHLIEDLQEINVVPFFDCGGSVPGSAPRSFPPKQRIPADDALTDILRTGVVLVGQPTGTKSSVTSPEVLYAQRAMLEIVGAIGAEYGVSLQTRFIRFPTATHVLRALHKGFIHFADARVLFEYISPQSSLGFRVRPTCALGASRLWMFVQNKNGLVSLEELHMTLARYPEKKSRRRVAVIEQELRSTVANVMPSGVEVKLMSLNGACDALLGGAVFAVFGMDTQQRQQLRSLLHASGKKIDSTLVSPVDWSHEHPLQKEEGEGSTSTASSPQQPFSFGAFKSMPLSSTPPGESPAASQEDPPTRSPLSGTLLTEDSYENSADLVGAAGDLFQELMKGEGLPMNEADNVSQGKPPWIEVDTGITAVMHSFVTVSLRPQRPNN